MLYMSMLQLMADTGNTIVCSPDRQALTLLGRVRHQKDGTCTMGQKQDHQ